MSAVTALRKTSSLDEHVLFDLDEIRVGSELVFQSTVGPSTRRSVKRILSDYRLTRKAKTPTDIVEFTDGYSITAGYARLSALWRLMK